MSRRDPVTDRARPSFAAWPLIVLAVALFAIPACSGRSMPRRVRLGPPERFGWVAQPVEFSAPPEPWEREGDAGGGFVGVRFILRGGGGQVLSVAAQKSWTERLPRERIEALIAEFPRLDERELYRRLSLLRVQIDDPLTDAESQAAAGLNAAVNRAETDVAGGHVSFVKDDLDAGLRAVDGFRPTLAELLPRLRLRPERMSEPARWILGRAHDTTLAGLPAFGGDDTLDAPEQRLLYRQVFWVVNGCAFQAIYQGRPENQHVFEQVLASVRFPEPQARASR
ncbi:MAG TPA: hypothetical protein VI504_12615 [Candidatus Eisenbacteria bacterium]|jgi:hypothetical protein